MFLVIAIIVGAILGFLCYFGEYGFYDWTDIFDFDAWAVGFMGAIIGALIGIMGIVFSAICFDTMPDSDKVIVPTGERVELIALKDNMNIHGQGFLFSSYIDEDLYYIYIYEDENRGMTTNKIRADRAYVRYLSDEFGTPYIEKFEETHKSDFLNWLWCWGGYGYTIYLPQGSVIENVYEIDLEG